MKVIENYVNDNMVLQGRSLLGALQSTRLIPWLESQKALPNGWRAIATIQIEDGGEMKTCEHLDIQSDLGGGSWAPAKHQALYSGADFTSVIPMEEIQDLIMERSLEDTEPGAAILEKEYFEQLTKPEVHWIVDVEDGLGIAPNYGGIKVPFSTVTYGTSGLETFKGFISVAFSGALAWQDVRYALYVLRETMDYICCDYRTMETRFTFDALEEDDTINTWLDEMGFLDEDCNDGCEQ